MTFLEAVNRVLRHEGIIAGSDSDVSDFNSSQHIAAVSLARQAIKSQLADMVAQEFMPFEDKETTINITPQTRLYDLPLDFVRMQTYQDDSDYMVETDSSGVAKGTSRLKVVKESDVRFCDDSYQEFEQDTPQLAYITTQKKMGIYPVPTATRHYRLYYEGDFSLEVEGDIMPFSTSTENETFLRMAARYFKYLFANTDMRGGLFPEGIERDQQILSTKAILCSLLRSSRRKNRYA